MTSLLIVCGALAREVLTLRDRHSWDADVQALPAALHNRPEKIPAAVQEKVNRNLDVYEHVVVVYGDCGTGGQLQDLLDQNGWVGLSTPHCYALFAGRRHFDRMMEEEPGTFFLTDYLAGSFDHLVTEGLGLDRYPELQEEYFGRYRRVVYLSQRVDRRLLDGARRAAAFLGLPLEVRHTALSGLESGLIRLLEQIGQTDGRSRTRHAGSGSNV